METAENVEIFNLSTLCRCCLADGQFKRLDVCYFEYGSEICADLLRDVFGIIMYSTRPEYSFSICDTCIEALHSAAAFKSQVLNCEKRFNEYCLNEQFNLEIANVKNESKSDCELKDEEIKKELEDPGGAYNEDIDFDAAERFDSKDDIEMTNEDSINQTKENKSEEKPKEGVRSKSEGISETKPEKRSKSENKPKKGSKSESGPKKRSKSEVKQNKLIKKTKRGNKKDTSTLSLKQRRLHVLVKHNNLRHKILCKGCCQQFSNIDEFKIHVHADHSKSKSLYSCRECSRSMKSLSSLNLHILSHQQVLKNWCYYCGVDFPNRTSRKEHEIKIHEINSVTFICDLCDKEFWNKSYLKKHINTHYGIKKFMCDICGLKIVDATNLAIHKTAVHDKIKSFKCDDCDAKFFTNKMLKMHKFSHKGMKPAKCCVCHSIFLSEEAMRKHKKKFHDEQKLQGVFIKDEREISQKSECVICNKTFINYRSFKLHVQSHKRQYSCEECGRIFAGKYSYTRHKFIKHTKGVDQRPFQCDVCQKKFSTLHVMLRHKANLHNPQKKAKIKVKCDVCKLSVADLEAHMKNHINRPFVCKYCDKTFPAKNALNRHLDIHENTTTFDCVFCTKKFKRKNGLERHSLKKHGSKVPKTVINVEFDIETCSIKRETH